MSRFAHSVAIAALTLALSGGALAVNKEETPADATTPPAATGNAEPNASQTRPAATEQANKPPSAEDAAVTDKLRDLIENKLSQHLTRERDRAGVLAFYRDRKFAPLWIANNAPLPRAKDAIAFLGGVGADGLDPADYPTPSFSNAAPEQLAADELRLTSSVLAFARHASTGRVAFTRVSGSIYFDLKPPEAADVLGKIATGNDIRATLDAFNPQHPAYKALKAQLAAARAGKDVEPAARAEPQPKQAAKSRKSKKAGRAAAEPKPQQAMTKSARADTIIANMERWRWLPRDLGTAHVVVNVPDYTLKVVNDKKTAWTTRIVVGKPGSYATPLLTETMKYITVNPTWNVPPSIIRNEYLPALARDPGALARIGLHVGRNSDGSIRIYQPPGERNALGRIRFNFPNKFLVYQHDTPQKHLFEQTARAYSHGCMRVQNPDQYAEVLLSISQPEEGYTAKRVKAMYGSGERGINFKKPIPVYITYQTAFVDEAGKLQTRADIYGLDKEIIAQLRDHRAVADLPIPRNYSSSSKPVMARTPSHAPRNEFASQPSGWSQSPGWGWQGNYSSGERYRTW